MNKLKVTIGQSEGGLVMNKKRRLTGDIVCLCLTVGALIIAILIRGYFLDMLYEYRHHPLDTGLTQEDIVICKSCVRLSTIIITATGIGTFVETLCLLWKIYKPEEEKCE